MHYLARILQISLLLLPMANCRAQPTSPAGFQSYWSEFRVAAISGDTDKVAAMTEFPFETKGETDSDPVVKHSRQAFLRLWSKLLASDAGELKPTSMRQLIDRTTAVPEKSIKGGAQARVGNFLFLKRQVGWRFTRAYLGDELQ
jgi:hypothetical protein